MLKKLLAYFDVRKLASAYLTNDILNLIILI